MNDQIAAIVDALFQNTVINEETLALHEELMNNCQEHYADLVARGETPEDALEIINDSLNGMKEVIAEYPRREEPDAAAALLGFKLYVGFLGIEELPRLASCCPKSGV